MDAHATPSCWSTSHPIITGIIIPFPSTYSSCELLKPSPTPYPAIYQPTNQLGTISRTATPSGPRPHQAQLADPQRNARTTFIFIFIFITDQPSSSSSSCQHSTTGKPEKKPGGAVYKRISSPTVRKSSPAINKQHQSLRFSRSEALLPATAAILIAGLHLPPSTFLRIFISIFVLIFTFLPIFLSASSYPHLHLLFIFIFIFLISSSLFIFIFHLQLPSSSSSCS